MGFKIISEGKEVETGSAGEVYSTNEVCIGTWIDGKPLYRIVIEVTLPSTKSTNYVLASLASYNVKKVLFIDGRWSFSGTQTQPINIYHTLAGGEENYVFINSHSTSNIVCTINGQPLGKACWLAITYTKTTD